MIVRAVGPEPGTISGVGESEVVMNRPDRKFRKRFAVLVTGGVLVAALFPMAGSVLAAVPFPNLKPHNPSIDSGFPFASVSVSTKAPVEGL